MPRHTLSAEEFGESRPDTTIGLYDLSPDHLYQLMRMTLLARTTTGMELGDILLEDYRVVHLTHSANDTINILKPEYLSLSPGLQRYANMPLHAVWEQILSPGERPRFAHGYWDKAIQSIAEPDRTIRITSRLPSPDGPAGLHQQKKEAPDLSAGGSPFYILPLLSGTSS